MKCVEQKANSVQGHIQSQATTSEKRSPPALSATTIDTSSVIDMLMQSRKQNTKYLVNLACADVAQLQSKLASSVSSYCHDLPPLIILSTELHICCDNCHFDGDDDSQGTNHKAEAKNVVEVALQCTQNKLSHTPQSLHAAQYAQQQVHSEQQYMYQQQVVLVTNVMYRGSHI